MKRILASILAYSTASKLGNANGTSVVLPPQEQFYNITLTGTSPINWLSGVKISAGLPAQTSEFWINISTQATYFATSECHNCGEEPYFMDVFYNEDSDTLYNIYPQVDS